MAKILYDFNGGGSSVQTYINQNEFFTKRVMEAISPVSTSQTRYAVKVESNTQLLIVNYQYGKSARRSQSSS